MRRHVSAEVLARYQEGDLGARRTASVAAHLSGCAQCSRTGSDLTAVSGLLASMGQPTMPPALADRLQLAIARESAARTAASAVSGAQVAAAGPASAADGVSESGLTDAPAAAGASQDGTAREGGTGTAHVPGRPDLPERSPRRRDSWPQLRWPGFASPALLRGTAAIAVVIVLAGVGFLLARGVSGPESSAGSGSSSGNGAAAPGSPAVHRPASSRVPARLTGSARLHYRLHGQIVTTTGVASHLNFTSHGLASQVHRAVASQPSFGGTLTSPQTTPTPANGKSSNNGLLGGIGIGQLNGCLSRVSAGRQVVLTEIARYLGRPATIIVLKSPSANILNVAIVGVACSASAADYIVRTTVPAG